MKQKGKSTIIKGGAALLALIVVAIIGLALFGGSTEEEQQVDAKPTPTLTAEDIAKVVTTAMESKDRIETRKKTEFPVVAPDKEYTDVMARLNEFGTRFNEKLGASEKTDARLITAIEKLTERLSEVEDKAKSNDSQIMMAVDEVTARLALMDKEKEGSRDEVLAAALNNLSSSLNKPEPKVNPEPPAKDERVDSIAERLAAMEKRMENPQPAAVETRDPAPVADFEVDDLRPTWNRPVETARGRPIRMEDLRNVSGSPAPMAPEEDLGLIRSTVSTAGETIEDGTDIVSDVVRGATDVAGDTVKELTRTAGRTIGGASQVTGDAVGGTTSLASKQGKRVWKKIW